MTTRGREREGGKRRERKEGRKREREGGVREQCGERERDLGQAVLELSDVCSLHACVLIERGIVFETTTKLVYSTSLVISIWPTITQMS